MIELAGALLCYPDGTFAFQRRDNKAPTYPNQLGFFGGHMEPSDSTPEAAARRELAEETSLPVDGLEFKHLISSVVPTEYHDHQGEIKVHIFAVSIPDEPFDIFEGAGTERYSMKEILAHPDLADMVGYLLNKFKEKL